MVGVKNASHKRGRKGSRELCLTSRDNLSCGSRRTPDTPRGPGKTVRDFSVALLWVLRWVRVSLKWVSVSPSVCVASRSRLRVCCCVFVRFLLASRPFFHVRLNETEKREGERRWVLDARPAQLGGGTVDWWCDGSVLKFVAEARCRPESEEELLVDWFEHFILFKKKLQVT